MECKRIASHIRTKENILWELGISAACQSLYFGNKQSTSVAALAALTNFGFISKFDLILSEPFEWETTPYNFEDVPIIKLSNAVDVFDLVYVAGILCRSARESFMATLNKSYPGFSWDTNAGYSTPQHLEAIKSLGVTPEHRNLDKIKSLHGVTFKPYRIENG
jgi:ribonuclease HII